MRVGRLSTAEILFITGENMKAKLQDMLTAKEERKAQIIDKIEKSEDLNEVRSLTSDLEALNAEIRDLNSVLSTLPSEEDARTQAVNQPVPTIVKRQAETENRKMSDDTDGMEYRKAFMHYVLKGTPIPAELRADANTLTTDVASAIPTVLVNRIVEKMESIGMILPLVTRTSYPSGVNIPTSSVKPVATWVAEGASSDRQKKSTGFISFGQNKLRCEISMSMEVSTMAISAFETAFVRQVSEAMVKAIESAIINGDGLTQPKGILRETPETGQLFTPTALTYDVLVDAEGAVPQAYETGAVWCMSKKTFMSFIGMKDDYGQPIARVNYGINGNPERVLLGRPVVLCGDYLPSFSSATTDQIYAFIFRFNDYVLNTIYDMGIQRKQDWDTEDMLTKAVMSVDGKVVDKTSLVVLKK